MISDEVQDSLNNAAQSEQELLGKEVGTEPLSRISNSEQATPEGELNASIKDQRVRQMERESSSVAEICKSLIANIEYLHRERHS